MVLYSHFKKSLSNCLHLSSPSLWESGEYLESNKDQKIGEILFYAFALHDSVPSSSSSEQIRFFTTPLQTCGLTPTSHKASTACRPRTPGTQSLVSPQVWPRPQRAPTSWLPVRTKTFWAAAALLSLSGWPCTVPACRWRQWSRGYARRGLRRHGRQLPTAASGPTSLAAAQPAPAASAASPLPAAASAVPTTTGRVAIRMRLNLYCPAWSVRKVYFDIWATRLLFGRASLHPRVHSDNDSDVKGIV